MSEGERLPETTHMADDALKAAFLAETDLDRRWDLLAELHERGWAYRPFNHAEPFAPRRDTLPSGNDAAGGLLGELEASAAEWDAIPPGQRLRVNADYWAAEESLGETSEALVERSARAMWDDQNRNLVPQEDVDRRWLGERGWYVHKARVALAAAHVSTPPGEVSPG